MIRGDQLIGFHGRAVVHCDRIGMDQNTIDHIFEPFFTTKQSDKGTGLGLASVYGIVKAHQGYIDVESKPCHGTTFSIYFPASEKKRKKHVLNPRTTGTVLIVDDTKAILDVTTKMFERNGFQVLQAESGNQAIDIYKEYGSKIDLILLDLVMPDMEGDEVFDKIKKLSPDIKVLISSGHNFNDRVNEMLSRGCEGFIQKPYDSKELFKKIGEVLEKSNLEENSKQI